MRFWSNTTWLLTTAAIVSCIAWVLTRDAIVGWSTLFLVVAAIAASYLAISEQEDEIGHRISDEERRALGEWAGQRRRESGRLREWERRRKA